MLHTLIFAHRGASAYAPENTMAAFELAIRQGSDGIETDAHLTKDGRVALMHDERLMRTTGEEGLLCERTMEELRRLDAGSWFEESFSTSGVPELCELLELAKPANILLNIELKNSEIRYEGLEEKVLAELRRLNMVERVIFSSFNHISMAWVKQLEPSAQTALLYSDVLYRPADYARLCMSDGLHPNFHHMDADLVAQAHAAGLAVRPWTVDNPEHVRTLAAMGVDAIITNDPKGVREALKA